MAYLVPDRVREEYGLVIREKIIPWGARWTKDEPGAGFRKGDLYKADQKLSGGSGKVEWVTIHNTGAISVNPATTMAEQYTRATWPNQNMRDVRVHYYIDGVDCWQNLREDEVGWHAGRAGNAGSLAIEIIGADPKAEERGALLAAILLHRHGLGLDRVVSHNRWYKGKYCPLYILPHWDKFLARVGEHLKAIRGEAAAFRPEVRVSGGFFRVILGEYADRAAAEQAAEVLRGREVSVILVPGEAGGFWLQAGAFRVEENAERMRGLMEEALAE